MNENTQNQTPVTNGNMINCKACGTPIAKKAKVCPNCGAKNKKPVFKRVWFWLLIAIVLIVIGSAIGGGNDAGEEATTKANGNAAVETKADAANEIGQYSVEIKSVRMTKTYDGKAAVIVTYHYANNTNDTPTAFDIAFEDQAYQNGVGLNKAYVLKDGENYNSDNQTKEIKKGASIDVEVAYELNDSTTPIEVEVKELFSFSDEIISKTFDLK
ncbi:MAG TPA: hypothetical protein DDY98_00305 [Ruminococcaceae bacterium]|nr:hypothetical protein [Oscillospiraceae bacterium]